MPAGEGPINAETRRWRSDTLRNLRHLENIRDNDGPQITQMTQMNNQDKESPVREDYKSQSRFILLSAKSATSADP